MTFYCDMMIKFELVLWAVTLMICLMCCLMKWVDVAFALKVLLWWNGLCDDDEACLDIIESDVIGTFGISN